MCKNYKSNTIKRIIDTMNGVILITLKHSKELYGEEALPVAVSIKFESLKCITWIRAREWQREGWAARGIREGKNGLDGEDRMYAVCMLWCFCNRSV